MKNSNSKTKIIIFFVCLVLGVMVALQCGVVRDIDSLTKNKDNLGEQDKIDSMRQDILDQQRKNKLKSMEFIRKTQIMRGQDYWEDVFYQGDEEIARQKMSHQGVLEKSGKIPDGKFKFVEDDHTYGEEYYQAGQKHGTMTTFYEDGKLKSEAVYMYGKLNKEKEFYHDGVVEFEIDYSDARTPYNDKEVGFGKLYYADGTLRYEWNITNSLEPGYKKAYNPDGQLRVVTYYDTLGNEISGAKK